jgi:eukaryotic-like serine/threonine-protein kinase
MTSEEPLRTGGGAPPPLTIVDLTDAACDRFEAEWRAGGSPRIETYLAEAPADATATLLRELLLLELELELARGGGSLPKSDDYRARFPDHIGVIDKVFAAIAPPGPAETTVMSRGADATATFYPKIDGYEILTELGEGGMGVVYKARQLDLNRVCALKMISTHGEVSNEVARRFLAETKAIAKLHHPNIVQIYHSGRHNGRLFFEMEYVEGGSLAQRLNGVPWPAARAARLLDSVARAVDEVHHHRVLHRDLKPANILLSADGAPKVADFGLAKTFEPGSSQTITGTILGTPSYMSPEQAHGISQAVGVATDIYALGAILYELLTGRPPFKGKTKLEILEKIKSMKPEAPSRLVPGLPGDIEAVCLKCLMKSPAARYDTARDLAEDLRRFINGEPTLTRPTDSRSSALWRSILYSILASTTLILVLFLCYQGVLLYRRGGVKEAALSSTAQTVVKPPGTPYVVQPGEFPFDIAAHRLGNGNRWKEMRMEDGRTLTEEDARNLLPGRILYLPPFPEP